jgi:hypothetical protein
MPPSVQISQPEFLRILYRRQIKPSRNEGGRTLPTILGGHKLGHPNRRLSLLSDLEQSANDVAHHVMQKRIGAQRKNDKRTLLPNVELMHGSDRMPRLALGRTKAAEIVFAEQRAGGYAHGIKIEKMM